VTARIVIVDDHALLAQSLTFALRARGFEADAVLLGPPETLVEQIRESAPDLVMLDMQLGEPAGSGVDLVAPFTEAGARVLVVSGIGDPLVVAAAVAEGAVGHVSKSQPFDELVETASRAAQGHEVLSAAERHDMVSALRRHRAALAQARRPFERLSQREAQVLRALCDGMSVSAIAAAWFVSVPTVRTQVRAVLLKLDVGSQLEAVTLAHRVGWASQT
jgi:DNA-binding NarL/FixJ family response regulator